MTTLATALKGEIRRLARKEIKTQTAVASRAGALHRREIAKLKRPLREQEKKLTNLAAQERKRLREPA